MNTIIIYRHTGAGRMWLCADGTLSSDKSQAAHHWDIQFQPIVEELSGFLCNARTQAIAAFEIVQPPNPHI